MSKAKTIEELQKLGYITQLVDSDKIPIPSGSDAPIEEGTGVNSIQQKCVDSFLYHEGQSDERTIAVSEPTTATGENSMAVGIGTLASGQGAYVEGHLAVTDDHVVYHNLWENADPEPGDPTSGYFKILHDTITLGEETKWRLSVFKSDGTFISDYFAVDKETVSVGDTVYMAELDSQTFIPVPARIIEVGDPTWSQTLTRTVASGRGAHAEGLGTIASGSGSHAEGAVTIAAGRASHSSGANDKFYYTKSDGTVVGDITILEVDRGEASGEASHTEGVATIASGPYSHAEGGPSVNSSTNYIQYRTQATEVGAHAEGIGTESSGRGSHSEGYETIASGYSAHAENYRSTAEGKYSHAEGEKTTATGQDSHVEGYGDRVDWGISSGFGSHAEGTSNASADYSHAEGRHTIASGNYSHAEGHGTTASGIRSHAEGFNTTASSASSHAEGEETSASAQGSHVEGKYRKVGSREFGLANGKYSHSEGSSITGSDAIYSHAEGDGTRTTNPAEHAEGRFNVSNIGTIHSVGIGDASKSKNAFEIMDDGKIYVFGIGPDLAVYDGTNPIPGINDLASIIQQLL